MDINEIYLEYSSKMVQIYLYQRAMKTLVNEELAKLNEYANTFKDKPDLLDLSSSHHSIIFRSAKDGNVRFLGHRKNTIEDRIKSVILHKNKQYQWLLAEAYEVYEDFLQQVYAYIGYIDHSLWPLVDYGNITLKELENKDFQYFLAQSRNKKDIPHSILSKLREYLPNYGKLEVKNKLDKNLKLMIILIEKLRHCIVHRGGCVFIKKEFIESVIKKAGLYNNGKYDQHIFDYMSGFFGENEFSNTIVVIEIRVMPELPILAEVNRFEILVETLTASVFAICEEVREMEKLKRSQ
jgi:hypothetical protein